MKIHSGSADVTGTLEQGGDGIVILETLSAGRVFRILKARHGTRYVALKAAAIVAWPGVAAAPSLQSVSRVSRTSARPCLRRGVVLMCLREWPSY